MKPVKVVTNREPYPTQGNLVEGSLWTPPPGCKEHNQDVYQLVYRAGRWHTIQLGSRGGWRSDAKTPEEALGQINPLVPFIGSVTLTQEA